MIFTGINSCFEIYFMYFVLLILFNSIQVIRHRSYVNDMSRSDDGKSRIQTGSWALVVGALQLVCGMFSLAGLVLSYLDPGGGYGLLFFCPIVVMNLIGMALNIIAAQNTRRVKEA